jgi:hypothetical protein
MRVVQEFSTRVQYKDLVQEFSTRVQYKSSEQEFSTTLLWRPDVCHPLNSIGVVYEVLGCCCHAIDCLRIPRGQLLVSIGECMQAVAGGTPVIDVLAATSLWATALLKTLAQVNSCRKVALKNSSKPQSGTSAMSAVFKDVPPFCGSPRHRLVVPVVSRSNHDRQTS